MKTYHTKLRVQTVFLTTNTRHLKRADDTRNWIKTLI